MGMASAYFYELLNRQFYYSQLVVNEEQQKTIENNLKLEAEVDKRTANLAKTNSELIVAKEAAEESERLKSVFSDHVARIENTTQRHYRIFGVYYFR